MIQELANIWKEFKKGDTMGLLKDEYKSFLDDIDKNIKDKDDLLYIKQRFATFLDVILDQMDYIVEYKKEEIEKLQQTQNELDEKMAKMQQVVDNIEKDIYAEDGFDFEIVCPYCNYEFVIDVDENKTEIECPECNNIIELDWTGENEEECSGHCSGCHGCSDDLDEEKQDEDDDM